MTKICLSFPFSGEDTVCKWLTNGRKAAWVVLIVQSLWRLRRVIVESDQQEWKDSIGELIWKSTDLHENLIYHFGLVCQPVGFVTFNTRAGAEAAKQDLQVSRQTFQSSMHRFSTLLIWQYEQSSLHTWERSHCGKIAWNFCNWKNFSLWNILQHFWPHQFPP